MRTKDERKSDRAFKLIERGLKMAAKATGATHIVAKKSPRGIMINYHYKDDPLFDEYEVGLAMPGQWPGVNVNVD